MILNNLHLFNSFFSRSPYGSLEGEGARAFRPLHSSSHVLYKIKRSNCQTIIKNNDNTNDNEIQYLNTIPILSSKRSINFKVVSEVSSKYPNFEL